MLGNLLSFAGGLIGQANQRSQFKSNQALTREQMRMQQSQFDAQMDTSIQRRVKDALAAGVHPLFALGASAGASPTASIGGQQSTSGGALGTALRGIGARIADAEIQSKSSSAKRDEAEAAYHNARTKLLEQKFASQGRDGASVPANPESTMADTGVVMGPAEYVAPQVSYSQRTGVAAGTHPGHTEYVDKHGVKHTLPSTDLNMDEIAQVKFLLNTVYSGGVVTRKKIEKIIQDVKQKRRTYFRRRSNTSQYGYDVAP